MGMVYHREVNGKFYLYFDDGTEQGVLLYAYDKKGKKRDIEYEVYSTADGKVLVGSARPITKSVMETFKLNGIKVESLFTDYVLYDKETKSVKLINVEVPLVNNVLRRVVDEVGPSKISQVEILTVPISTLPISDNEYAIVGRCDVILNEKDKDGPVYYFVSVLDFNTQNALVSSPYNIEKKGIGNSLENIFYKSVVEISPTFPIFKSIDELKSNNLEEQKGVLLGYINRVHMIVDVDDYKTGLLFIDKDTLNETDIVLSYENKQDLPNLITTVLRSTIKNDAIKHVVKDEDAIYELDFD